MKRRSRRAIIAHIREKRDRCCLHDMTFAPVPEKYKQALEAEQKDGFYLWWDSWVEPLLVELEAKEKP